MLIPHWHIPQVVGISMDSLEKHAEFCTAKSLTFPLLSDSKGSVSAAYGVREGGGREGRQTKSRRTSCSSRLYIFWG